jgi:RNA polymerase sigma-70 factor, ECF subfamily
MAMETYDERFQKETDLARRVSEGDPDALGKLYENYFECVYFYFFEQVESPFEAQILTTQTFCLAIEALMCDDCLWEGKGFGSWFYGIACKIFEEYSGTPLIEDLKRILERDDSIEDGEDIFDFIVRREEQKMLWQLVNELEPLERRVLTLYHKKKLSAVAITRHLGCSEDRCKQLDHQALTNLKYKVQTHDLWSEAREG